MIPLPLLSLDFAKAEPKLAQSAILKLTINKTHGNVGFITYFKFSLLKRLKNIVYLNYIITQDWIAVLWCFPQFLA